MLRIPFHRLSADNLMLSGTLMANANDLHFISLLSYMKCRMSLQNIFYNELTNCIQFLAASGKVFACRSAGLRLWPTKGRKRMRRDLFRKFYKPADAAVSTNTSSAFTQVRFSCVSFYYYFGFYKNVHSKFQNAKHFQSPSDA